VALLVREGVGEVTNPKGTKLETASVNWLKEHGWQWARRIVKEGIKDKGDVTLGDGIPVTIECKNEKAMNISQAQRELAVEMANAGHKWGFAIHKKRGTTNVGEYYAVLPVAVLMDILDAALEHEGQRLPLRRSLGKTTVIPSDQDKQALTKANLELPRRVVRRKPHTTV
jgi:hypothetical protein